MRSVRKNNIVLKIIFITLLATVSISSLAEDKVDNPTSPDKPDAIQLNGDPQPAAPSENSATGKKSSLFERWFDVLENARDNTSRHYMSMVHSIDAYISGEKIETTSNGSYLRVQLQNTFYKNGEHADGINIDAKVELPNTQKHLKLIFSSEPEEDKSLADKITNNVSGDRIKKENSIAGIEYTPEKTESNWTHSFTTGIKLHVTPIPFMRYKFGKQWQLDENWRSSFSQSFWDYQDKGLGATTRLNFIRPLSDEDLFKAETQAEYRDRDNQYTYSQIFSNTHRLSEQSAIIYSVGALGQSQPTSEVTDYLIGVEYRRALYKDWLLLNVHPLLEFPREQNWEATPSLILTLQVYFTE